MNNQKIINKPSTIWELGTDCLTESDLKLLDVPYNVSFTRDEGAIFHIDTLQEVHHLYSPIMGEILKQALEHGYEWIMFDCDIETEVELC